MPQDQLFWVKLQDFLDLAKSDDNPHLHDFPIFFDPPLASTPNGYAVNTAT